MVGRNVDTHIAHHNPFPSPLADADGKSDKLILSALLNRPHIAFATQTLIWHRDWVFGRFCNHYIFIYICGSMNSPSGPKQTWHSPFIWRLTWSLSPLPPPNHPIVNASTPSSSYAFNAVHTRWSRTNSNKWISWWFLFHVAYMCVWYRMWVCHDTTLIYAKRANNCALDLSLRMYVCVCVYVSSLRSFLDFCVQMLKSRHKIKGDFTSICSERIILCKMCTKR